MGFLTAIGRMLQGKPVFQVGDTHGSDDWDDNAPTIEYAEERKERRAEARSATSGLVDAKGYKRPPVVSVVHVKTDLGGDRFDLWITLQNQSDRDTHLDKFSIFGGSFGLNHPLAARDRRAFRVYSGPLLKHDDYRQAELYYRDAPTGDYFRADYMIEYHFESDESYTPVEMKMIMPIRDI